jgi:hypothetical protein
MSAIDYDRLTDEQVYELAVRAADDLEAEAAAMNRAAEILEAAWVVFKNAAIPFAA